MAIGYCLWATLMEKGGYTVIGEREPKRKRSEPMAQRGPKVRATLARRKKNGIGNVP